MCLWNVVESTRNEVNYCTLDLNRGNAVARLLVVVMVVLVLPVFVLLVIGVGDVHSNKHISVTCTYVGGALLVNSKHQTHIDRDFAWCVSTLTRSLTHI